MDFLKSFGQRPTPYALLSIPQSIPRSAPHFHGSAPIRGDRLAKPSENFRGHKSMPSKKNTLTRSGRKIFRSEPKGSIDLGEEIRAKL